MRVRKAGVLTIFSGHALIAAVALLSLLCVTGLGSAGAQTAGDEFQLARAGNTFVHTQFGGQVFGFDIDQNGSEGVLSEAQTLSNGNVLAAVETFDQRTGKILNVEVKTQTQDDFVTMGIVGNAVGLVEREHVVSFLNVQRTFAILNPVSANKFTGTWKPPIDKKHIVSAVSRNQGSSTVAVFAEDVSGNFTPVVFSSNVAANTFGPVIKITDQNFTSGSNPAMAYDSGNNTAVLAHSTLGNPFVPPFIALVDLSTGTFTTFQGQGLGDVNGIAVDPVTHIACTTTEINFSVQFYDLVHQTGFNETLPGATNQIFSGADVQFDPIHKLFLVAQPVSSTAARGSSIHVFDEQGNVIESINGFSFSNTFNVVPAHIALKPSTRSGFVDGPDAGVTEIQSFRY